MDNLRQAEEEDLPVKEYRALKEDLIGQWGFLDDTGFATRIAAVFAVALVPGLLFSSAVFPSFIDDELAVPNVAAAFLFGVFAALLAVLAVNIRLGQQFDAVNKLLQRNQYVVEYDPTTKIDYGSGSGGAYSFTRVKSPKDKERDRLIAEYETEPALARVRMYIVGSLGSLVASWAGGSVVGGEFREVEEEEEDEISALFYKKKKCGAGCVPGQYD